MWKPAGNCCLTWDITPSVWTTVSYLEWECRTLQTQFFMKEVRHSEPCTVWLHPSKCPPSTSLGQSVHSWEAGVPGGQSGLVDPGLPLQS